MPRKKATTINPYEARELAKKIFIKRKFKEIGVFFGWIGIVFIALAIAYAIGSLIIPSPDITCMEEACPFGWIIFIQAITGLFFVTMFIVVILFFYCVIKTIVEYIRDWIMSNWKASIEEANKILGDKHD